MSTESIRKALEVRLAALAPSIVTAYENVTFTPPAADVAYQQAFLLPGQPDNSEMGSTNYFDVGVFQVTLCYPIGNGPGAAQARAELLRLHFKRGTSLVQDGITVIVMRTPAVAGGFRRDDRWCVSVSITYQAHISL